MTPTYFVDANIILDALLHRGDEAIDAGRLIDLGYTREVRLLVTPMSLGVVLYVLQKKRSARKAGPNLNKVRSMFHDLLACVEVVPVTKGNFSQSLNSNFLDLEDGVQYEAAMASGRLTALVSRDEDYKGRTAVPLYTASQALVQLSARPTKRKVAKPRT